MKINVKLSLDDGERDALADYIDGKVNNRMASRKDVNNFVAGCMAAALTGLDKSLTEQEEIKKLRDAGFDDSYIRGWLQVAKR